MRWDGMGWNMGWDVTQKKNLSAGGLGWAVATGDSYLLGDQRAPVQGPLLVSTPQPNHRAKEVSVDETGRQASI